MRNKETGLYLISLKIRKQVHLHNLSYDEYIGNRDIYDQVNDIKEVHLHNLYMRNILPIGPYLVRSMTKSRSTYITFL